MRTWQGVSVVLLGALVVACTNAPEAPPAAAPAIEQVANTRQVMLGLTVPASDVLWQLGDHVPGDDAGWERVVATAAMLAESGNLLLVGPRHIDQPAWTQFARELVATARQAMEAAQRRDVDAVLEAGDAIYGTCEGCHEKYMPAKLAEQAGAATP